MYNHHYQDLEVPQIRGFDGKPIILNGNEVMACEEQQKELDRAFRKRGIRNDLGAQVNITTLTAIIKRITEQKFATLSPAKYMPVIVGEGAWMTSMIKYRSFSIGDNFEDGLINTGANNSALAKANTGVDKVDIAIKNWAMETNYSLPDLKFAATSGNWDLVEALERSRKTIWDLGIQRVAFLGMSSDTSVKGLLTLAGITSNTTLITGYVSEMNPTEFNTFVAGIVKAYRTNNNFTAYPTHFVMPELDYNGLASAASADFPVINKLSYLLEAFKVITGNQNFQILPCFYADEINNTNVSGLNKNRYVLLNYDQDSFSMNIPVNYNATQQNTINGFNWQNVGYGQFTGVVAYRPLEILYFDWAEV